jgi:hypothetical protein
MADSPPADMSPPASAAPDADVAERITVGVPPARAYQAVSDVHRRARWSPECAGCGAHRDPPWGCRAGRSLAEGAAGHW